MKKRDEVKNLGANCEENKLSAISAFCWPADVDVKSLNAVLCINWDLEDPKDNTNTRLMILGIFLKSKGGLITLVDTNRHMNSWLFFFLL